MRLTYLTVSCTLNTNFRNQVYNTKHFSRGDTSTNTSYPPIILDGSKVVTNYAIEGQQWGTFSRIIFFDSPANLGVGTRQIFAFSIPSVNSVANFYDTTVLINIMDTVYLGHAIVTVSITDTYNNYYTVPNPTFSGNFSMSGTVSSGSNSDSVSFSSSGTFTNMSYY